MQGSKKELQTQTNQLKPKGTQASCEDPKVQIC
jgi:hypothetical protein